MANRTKINGDETEGKTKPMSKTQRTKQLKAAPRPEEQRGANVTKKEKTIPFVRTDTIKPRKRGVTPIVDNIPERQQIEGQMITKKRRL